jgi:hypothetical protein
MTLTDAKLRQETEQKEEMGNVFFSHYSDTTN